MPGAESDPIALLHHRAAERPIESSGIGYTFLRPGVFADAAGVVNGSLLDFLAASAGRVAAVHDAVPLITGHPGRTFAEWAIDHAGDFV
jgi:uncharacterized protein YbjT (DUF2867 family)